jgi:polyisoprenoid-binding protein YceI
MSAKMPKSVDAESVKGTSVFNAAKGELAFSVPIRSFQFQKSLMQEHFNENYMESDRYPNASFRGQILEKPDFSKNGTYPVNVKGTLEVHGVKQNRTIPGKITVNNGATSMTSTFLVLCKDHQIEIPKLVFQKIAESIQVQVAANYAPLSK